MALRCKRIKDGVVFNWTKTLSERKGFVVFDDAPQKKKVEESSQKVETDLSKMNRGDIGRFILEKYDVQIPKMNRKKDLILVDAYKIMEECDSQAQHDKAIAESKEGADETQANREQNADE